MLPIKDTQFVSQPILEGVFRGDTSLKARLSINTGVIISREVMSSVVEEAQKEQLCRVLWHQTYGEVSKLVWQLSVDVRKFMPEHRSHYSMALLTELAAKLKMPKP